MTIHLDTPVDQLSLSTEVRQEASNRVAELRRMLRETSGSELARAAMRVAELGADGAAALDELIDALENGGGGVVHWAAAYALGEIGPSALTALPALKRASDVDPSADVRIEARDAIRRISG